MKVGEDNPQARDEETKPIFLKHGAQFISSWNYWNVGMVPGWKS